MLNKLKSKWYTLNVTTFNMHGDNKIEYGKQKLYRDSFQFLGKDTNQIFIDKIIKRRSIIPPDNHYMVYQLISSNGKIDGKESDNLSINIATKSVWEDFHFNILQRNTFLQKIDNWKFLIPICISIGSLIISILSLLKKTV